MSWVQPKFDEFVRPPNKKRKFDNGSKAESKVKDVKIKDESWWERFRPRTRADLVINKKKVEEVETWLRSCAKLDVDGGRILLITGPPGSGKMSTLKVLCKNLKLGLTEWMTPFSSHPEDLYTPQLKAFAEFVIRATRYKSVLVNAPSARIMVVKDIPNIFIRDPPIFHELLKYYSKESGVHIVFIITDSKTVRELFPEDLKRDAKVQMVTFNPITTKALTKALELIVRKDGVIGGESYIKEVATTSGGDLRNAIETLHFLTARQKVMGMNQLEGVSPDDFVDLFRGLGRVLYSKRDPTTGLCVHDLNSLASSFEPSATLFVSMLHENYLSTFSSMASVAASSVYLSNSNLLLSDFLDASLSRSIALSIATKGLAHHNSTPVKKFQHFSRPTRSYQLLDAKRNELRVCFPNSGVTDWIVDCTTYLKIIQTTIKTKEQKFLLKEFSFIL